VFSLSSFLDACAEGKPYVAIPEEALYHAKLIRIADARRIAFVTNEFRFLGLLPAERL
jgi:hypothetical protein